MGYSISREVLEARRGDLLELELGRACRWTLAPDRAETRRKAYQLREALYIAGLYPNEYPALARAYQTFSIVIVQPGVIEAKPRLNSVNAATTPVHGLQPFGKPVPTVELTRAAEIIDAWQAHAPSLDAINFQQASLSDAELTVLWNWANEHTPRLMILAGAGFLTLSLRDAEVAPWAWSPPSAPKPPEEQFDV